MSSNVVSPNSSSRQSEVSLYGLCTLSQEEVKRLNEICRLMVGKTTSFEQVLRMVKDAIAGTLTNEQALFQLEMKV